MKSKVCNECKVDKPFSEFNKTKDSKDGLQWKCRSCQIEIGATARREYLLEYGFNLGKEENVTDCLFKRWWKNKEGRCRFGVRKGGEGKVLEFNIEPSDIPGVKIKNIYYKPWSIAAAARKGWSSKDVKNMAVGKGKVGIKSWVAKDYPKVCSKWGIKLDYDRKNGISQYNSPSLDRKDPDKGYIPGNVRIVCQSYNMAKYNCPPDKWDVIEKQIARYILSHQQLDTNPKQMSLF